MELNLPEVIKETKGTCPVCVEMVPAQVIVEAGIVYIEKNCPEHGKNRGLLSRAPEYYKELMAAFFELMPKSLSQRDYIIRLTARCNMSCPICLASANDYEEKDLSFEDLKKFLRGKKKTKLDLMGAEPTLRNDLEQIIRYASDKGHITALHTNGIRIGEPEYLEKLVNAGLDEVHLQLDGFSDDDDMVIRGEPMGEKKMRALASLEKFDISTDLVVTVLQDLNEKQMPVVLDWAADHPFVKEVFYLGCRRLGRATEQFAGESLAPDELIDMLEEQTTGKINRNDIRVFQKLYFALLALFKVRKCFYIHHYMLLRTKSGWKPISELMDLAFLEPRLDRFRKIFTRSRIFSGLYLSWNVLLSILKKGGFSLLTESLVLTLMLMFGFDLSKIQRKSLLLGFITACDPWIYDEQVSANCGKGEISNDQGNQDSGADANVGREKDHRQIDSKRKSD